MGCFIASTSQHSNPHSPDSLDHNADALSLRYCGGPIQLTGRYPHHYRYVYLERHWHSANTRNKSVSLEPGAFHTLGKCTAYAANRGMRVCIPTRSMRPLSVFAIILPALGDSLSARLTWSLCLEFLMPLTSVCLSWGEDRASTRSCGHTQSSRACCTWRGRRGWVARYLGVKGWVLSTWVPSDGVRSEVQWGAELLQRNWGQHEYQRV